MGKTRENKKASSRIPKEKSQRSCSNASVNKAEKNIDVKTSKIVQKLQELGKKYACDCPSDYAIQSHHQFKCKMSDGTIRDIVVVVREEDISVFCRPNLPQWFEGNSRVEDALKEVEKLLESPNGSP